MDDRKEQELLKQQIMDIMNEDHPTDQQQTEYQPVDRQWSGEQEQQPKPRNRKPLKKKKHKGWKTVGIILGLLLITIAAILGTKSGRRLIYHSAGNFVYSNIDNDDIIKEYQESEGKNVDESKLRQEDYVTNYLIFGIEEFGGARNTDSMMIATINTKDDTLKLTSLLRDSYVEIPGYKSNKLNSAYARGGARLLVDTIELNYKIKIDGYASVDFKSFEKIVDLLGGVDIELGKEEAQYLNTTNYISKKANRHVTAGVNHLNGNQLMGYCRVRKVKTLGDVNNDYGRILRQQRALKAMFKSYLAPKNMLHILPNTKKILGYVTTNLSEEQIEKAMEDIVENKMDKLDTSRIPVDGEFESPRRYNGIGYPILLDWETNRVALYQFVFGDSKKEAAAALAALGD